MVGIYSIKQLTSLDFQTERVTYIIVKSSSEQCALFFKPYKDFGLGSYVAS